MMIQKNNIYGILALFFLALGYGCAEEGFEIPDSEARIVDATVSRSLPGGEATVSATITDPVGISEVTIVQDNWSISESIAVGNETSYTLDYKLNIPDSAKVGGQYMLMLWVTNANNVEVRDTLTLSLSLDTEGPTIINNTAKGVVFMIDGSDVTLDLKIEDAEDITTLTISNEAFSDEVAINSVSYQYKKALNFLKEGNYELEVTAMDVSGNTTTEHILLIVRAPFEQMYLADVNTDAELQAALMGVPVRVGDVEDEAMKGKAFQAKYYNHTANTAVRFIPSKDSFAPLTIGAGSEANTLQLAVDAAVDPIVLTEVGYYEILINLEDLSYTAETYVAVDSAYAYTMVMGTGIRVNGASTCEQNADPSVTQCWHFASGKRLTKDANNPYLFHGELEFYDQDPSRDNEGGFILGANENGWSDFWRFDNSTEPEASVRNGGSNYSFTEDAFGTYEFSFDTHLNYVRLTPKK
ncbi:hypothetical protein [Marinoscillum sp.]|uniref:hypothetical protein n=1 Tax=Marinoscillum sp. TaxID=2024838 RepID=UPI003BAD94DC